jgi:uncharacterized FAD-dependent dehydrogenase
MDPITLLATATALFNGVKKAVEVGREAQDILGQLSEWAGVVGQLEEFIGKSEKKPSIFKKISFNSSETKEAFNELVAKQKIREMEADIRHEFLYGGLCHLGLDGYREFIEMRRKIREKRIKIIQDQQIRRRRFIENLFTTILATLIIAVGIAGVWFGIYFIIDNVQ